MHEHKQFFHVCKSCSGTSWVRAQAVVQVALDFEWPRTLVDWSRSVLGNRPEFAASCRDTCLDLLPPPSSLLTRMQSVPSEQSPSLGCRRAHHPRSLAQPFVAPCHIMVSDASTATGYCHIVTNLCFMSHRYLETVVGIIDCPNIHGTFKQCSHSRLKFVSHHTFCAGNLPSFVEQSLKWSE